MKTDPKLIIRPVRIEDTDAIWQISRQSGVLETIVSLPSDRFEKRERHIRELGPDDH